MLRFCILCLLTVLLVFPVGVCAAEVDCDATYCFSTGDFSSGEELRGICVTGLPASSSGTVMLGARVIRTGDILTAQQVSQMTFCPLRTEQDATATLTYLPIYSGRVEPPATMTISIRGKEDKTPVAEDCAIETYKNLPNEGKLKVSDPEGLPMRYTLVRKPKRGEVTLHEDGSFTYTPKKNKVGVDSFTFTAADPGGNVSREATVTVQILKPTDSRKYTDTVGEDCRFAAEWMRNTGLFVGEKIGDSDCFHPDKTVSRGEFLSMVIHALDIPTENVTETALPENTPQWLKPYLCAAIRSGLTANIPFSEDGSFDADAPVTGCEAAVILQNALALNVSGAALESASMENSESDVPAWAQVSLTAMADNGIALQANAPLTRGDAATVLYQVSRLSATAPGMAVIRMQK